MTAYVIFIREGAIFDPDEMAEYQRKTAKLPLDPQLIPLVVYGRLQVLEGEAPDGVVMLQFPSMAAANSWYESSGYQEAAQHRKKGANYRAFIVQGL